MQNSEKIDLRGELEAISSGELSRMLRAELEKQNPDDDLVVLIMHILEDREPEDPRQLGPKENRAWQRFQKRVRARGRRRTGPTRLANAAALVLILGLLFTAIPQVAEADSWWQRFAHWTDNFFGFTREGDSPVNLEEYEFHTDNPGLQQLYDAVVEMGVTFPVVPQWLPEGYELVEFSPMDAPYKRIVYARFVGENNEISFQIIVLNADRKIQYFKDQSSIIQFERSGIEHNIIKNLEKWTVSWAKDNVECMFTADCREEILYEIIESIYRRSVNQ